jgi:2-polyprenyl-3-methyl-5-hydroxy-6-metoxy-1,4-benzoquinol methylase
VDAAIHRIENFQTRLQGRVPIKTDFRYLDISCDSGDIATGLANLGALHVTGIDMVPRCISAAIATMRRMQLSNRLEFVCDNIYNWALRQQFDVVLSHEALEHVHDPKSFLQILKHFVKPDEIAGACVQLSVSFAPLG